MIQLSAIKRLFSDSITQMNMSTNKLTLVDNQVVQGQVLKLFPDQKALIQVGQTKLVAQLEASINALDRYWFRVKGSEQQGLQLKIMKQVDGNPFTKLSVAKDLLMMFQQKTSKENILLVSELVKEHIPITKEQLLTALELLENTSKKDLPLLIDATKYAIKQQYPLSENVIKSLVQIQSSIPLAQQIDSLFYSLQGLNEPTSLVKQLQQSLLNIISIKQFELDSINGLTIKEVSKELQALREMLLVVSKEGVVGGSVKDQVDSLILRIDGQTLLQQELGPTSQMISQIPLFALNNTDLTIQWTGKKQENGKIDPSFCRIIFFLQLPILKETLVDVQIQNRVMTIIITNNLEALKPLVIEHTANLKELLNELDYHLSSIQVKSINMTADQIHPKKQFNITSSTGSYTGVDVKI
ncbi:MAG TPA: hypothetical protein VEY70_07805 [Metabacillus sp.]|nr:hypothetical protein [Metabacillus sp.]